MISNSRIRFFVVVFLSVILATSIDRGLILGEDPVFNACMSIGSFLALRGVLGWG